MQLSRMTRLAPLSGVAFAVLWVAGLGLATSGSPDEWLPPSEEVVRYYEQHTDAVIIGTLLVTGSLVFLLWFLGSARAAFGRAEGGDERVANIGFGGGLIGAAMILVGASATTLPAFRVDEHDTVDPTTATTLNDLGGHLWGAAAPLAFGVLVATTAVMGFRHRAVSRWLAWLSAVLAVGLLFPLAPWVAIMVFPLWVVIISVALYRRQRVPDASGSPAVEAPTTEPDPAPMSVGS